MTEFYRNLLGCPSIKLYKERLSTPVTITDRVSAIDEVQDVIVHMSGVLLTRYELTITPVT